MHTHTLRIFHQPTPYYIFCLSLLTHIQFTQDFLISILLCDTVSIFFTWLFFFSRYNDTLFDAHNDTATTHQLHTYHSINTQPSFPFSIFSRCTHKHNCLTATIQFLLYAVMHTLGHIPLIWIYDLKIPKPSTLSILG